MIRLTRVDGRAIVINSDLIEFVEATPDTLVSLTTGKKIIVRESEEQVIEKVAAFRRLCSATSEAFRHSG
jgi:flagellar protein FlbD